MATASDDVCDTSVLKTMSNPNEFRVHEDALRTKFAKHAGARRETTVGKSIRVHIDDSFLTKSGEADHLKTKFNGCYGVINENAKKHTDPVVEYGSD